MAPVMRLSSAFSKLLVAASLPAAFLLLGAGFATPAAAARKPRPDLTIALPPLGFGTMAAAYLQAGQTMFSLNFVDDTHLLLSFNTKGLLPRLADAEPDDEDRNVAALLLELPSGKVVAKTTWRTRDHGRYLWPVGHGRFLLRVRNRFSVIEPMVNLAGGDAFQQKDLIAFERRIALVEVSPDGGLMMVETAPPRKAPLIGAAASAAALAATVPGAQLQQPRTQPLADYQLRFYRLVTLEEGGKQVFAAQTAGGVRSRQPIEIAMTPLGYLGVVKESPTVYDFDFHSYTGKKLELSPFDTSCPPHAMFTSMTDFIAFGCRGGTDRNELSAFNLRGEEPWVSVLPATQSATFLRTSPAVGRFALSLVSGAPAAVPGVADASAPIPSEQVEVMQHHDGRVLLTVLSSPIQVAGQNFDLSPDGLSLAAVQRDQIGVYRLPPVTGRDRKAVTLSAAAFSEPAEGPVRLEAYAADAEGGQQPDDPKRSGRASAGGGPDFSVVENSNTNVSGAGAVNSPMAAPDAGTDATPSAASAGSHTVTQEGDVQPEPHRKAPSLYDEAHPKEPN